MGSDLILLVITLGLGILIGYNNRAFRDHDYKKQLLKEIDNELKDQLIVSNNLNESLKQDIAELKSKLRSLELKR
jgi:flagellar motility protein MotE (MotC chaperone)